MTTSVLLVCLGNICRSPMAEAVLADVAAKRGIEIHVDSAGTAGYHVGEEPDERTISTCKKHGVRIDHAARQVSVKDFTSFSHIFASDSSNLSNLERIKPKNSTAVVRLFGSYSDGKSIDDPYYGGIAGFERCYQQCVKYSEAFLDDLLGNYDTSARPANSSPL